MRGHNLPAHSLLGSSPLSRLGEALIAAAIEGGNDKLVEQDKATQLYEFFADMYPTDFFALNLLGDLYRQRKQDSKAAGCYRRSLSIKPTNGRAVLGLRKIEAASK